MSENSACSHGNYPENIKFGTVGKAMPNTEVKITSDGEIIMKNGCIMEGYFKDKEKTNKVLKNGFLHTGDKGIIDKDGFLKITGRIKDIFKTSKGKYVAPSPIEMKLSANKNLEQICVVGSGLPQPIVLVVLSDRGKAKSKEDLIASLEKTMEVVNPKLDKHEKLHNIVVVTEEWTIENNLLTPTMKIKRNAIEKIYKSSYGSWYEGERVFLI